MPITSEQDLAKAKDALARGIGDPEKLKAAIIKYQMTPHIRTVPVVTSEQGLERAKMDMGPGPDDPVKEAIGNYSRTAVPASNSFLGWDPSKEKAGDNLGTGARERANAQGYNIDLGRPDAVILQPGETPGSLRLKKLREKLEDRNLPNASKLKVFSEPAEYIPEKTKPVNPFNPMNPFANQAAEMGPKYFHEATVAEFRNDVAKNPELQARLAKDFPQISDKLKSKVSDNDISMSDTFLAYQDARWRMAYADGVKSGKPVFRLAYTSKLSPEQKKLAEAQDELDAGASGAGQAMSLGILDPITQAINLKLAEENRSARQRSPNATLGGELAGSMLGTPRLLFNALKGGAEKLGAKALGRYAPGVIAGAGTGAIDDSSRQVARSVSEALDAHDSALETLDRIWQQYDPDRTGVAGLMGGGMAFAGEGLADLADAAGRKIVTNPARLPVINQNINSGGMMNRAGGIRVEPEIQAGEAIAARGGSNLPDEMSQKLANKAIEGQRLAQESLLRDAEAETAAAHAAMRKPVVKNGSMSMGPESRPTGPTAARIRALADQFSGGTPEAKALMRRIQNFADFVENKGSVDVHGLDRLEADADLWAKNNGDRPNEIGQEVAAIVKKLRDEFDIPAGDATVVDRPQYAVRNSKGEERLVGKYSGLNADQANRMRMLEYENKSLGLPDRIPVAPRKVEPVKLDVLEEPDKGLFDKLHGTTPETYNGTPGQIEALVEGKPEVNLEPSVRKGAADRIKGAARMSDASPEREAIIRAGERSGPDFRRGLDIIRKAQDRGDYQRMLGAAISNMGHFRWFNSNQLLRLVPTLKGIAGGRPTPPRVEPTQMMEQALEELLRGKTVTNSGTVLGQELPRSGAEVMDKFVPELGGGLLHIGDGRLPAGAGSINQRRKGEESVLQKLSPEEQRFLVELVSNLAKMSPEPKQ